MVRDTFPDPQAAPTNGDLEDCDRICEARKENNCAFHAALEELAVATDNERDRELVNAMASLRLSHATIIIALQRGVHALIRRIDRSSRDATNP